MKYDEVLREALKVVPLTQIDGRLDMPSELSQIESDTEHVPPLERQISDPAQVNVNLIRHEPCVFEDNELDPEIDLDAEIDAGLEGDLDDITDDDIPSDEPPAGLPSGNEYTLDMAKGQLDGIIEKWMDLAGNYPEGKQRHDFIEIGERLREISGVLHRDFIAQKGVPDAL